MASNFQDLKELLLKARQSEKKLAYATYARVIVGTKAEPETIAIKHHATDILLFHKDGSIDISTYHRCDSGTTKERFRTYAGVHLTSLKLKAVNGFAVREKSAMFLCYGWGQPFVAWNADNDRRYIRLNPDKSFDMSTVEPHKVTTIVKTLEMRRAMRKVGKIAQIALGVYKLANEDHKVFRNGNIQVDAWLLQQYAKPLEETTYRDMPFIWDRQDPKETFKKAMDDVRWTIARAEGFTGTHHVLLG